MTMPLPVIGRSIKNDKLTQDQLLKFMRKHGIGDKELSELLGVTIQAVRLWTSGQRDFSITNSRLIKLFDKHPTLMREF